MFNMNNKIKCENGPCFCILHGVSIYVAVSIYVNGVARCIFHEWKWKLPNLSSILFYYHDNTGVENGVLWKNKLTNKQPSYS